MEAVSNVTNNANNDGLTSNTSSAVATSSASSIESVSSSSSLALTSSVSPVRVFYRRDWCTEQDQRELHSKLPISHDYGDKQSLFPDKTVCRGRKDHDQIIDPVLRIRTRKRCTVVEVLAKYTGSGTYRKALNGGPVPILVCFVSMFDWHAIGLDADTFFLHNAPVQNQLMPKIGNFHFNLFNYISNAYDDILLGLNSVRMSLKMGQRAHIKLIPLGVGPTITTRFGDPLGPFLIPAYVAALQYALIALVDATWVHTLEIIDHTQGQLSPYFHCPNVRFITTTRDAFDFGHVQYLQHMGLNQQDSMDSIVHAVIAPADSFCRIGGVTTDRNLASTLANNSNMRELVDQNEIQFIAI